MAHLTLDKQREAALTRGDHEWARQLDRQAQIKLGKNAAAMERNGIATERGDRLREIEALNEARRQIAELERMAALEAKAEPQPPPLPKAPIPEPVLEPEPPARAIDRQRAEELAEEIERAGNRKRAQSPARELFSAIKRLFITLGGSLGNVLLTNPHDMRGDGSGVSETEKRNEAIRRAMDEQTRNPSPQPAPEKMAIVPETPHPDPAAPPRPQREAWMHQRGGVEPLNEQHLQEARKSYATWSLANQERAAKFPFENYVAYVQRKDAERNHEPDVEFNTGPMVVKSTPVQPAPPAPAPQPRETYLERKRREARERGEIEPEFGPLPQKPRNLEMEFGPRRKRNPHDNLPD